MSDGNHDENKSGAEDTGRDIDYAVIVTGPGFQVLLRVTSGSEAMLRARLLSAENLTSTEGNIHRIVRLPRDAPVAMAYQTWEAHERAIEQHQAAAQQQQQGVAQQPGSGPGAILVPGFPGVRR